VLPAATAAYAQTGNIYGDLYEFNRVNALAARDYFNPKGGPQNPFVRNQFGASLGGPIIKNKTFLLRQLRMGSLPDYNSAENERSTRSGRNPVYRRARVGVNWQYAISAFTYGFRFAYDWSDGVRATGAASGGRVCDQDA